MLDIQTDFLTDAQVLVLQAQFWTAWTTIGTNCSVLYVCPVVYISASILALTKIMPYMDMQNQHKGGSQADAPLDLVQ